MSQETQEAILDLLNQLDTNLEALKNQMIEEINGGIMQSGDPNIVERLESMTENYRHQLEQLRARFLQTQDTDSVCREVRDVMQEYGSQLEVLDLQIESSVMEQSLDLIESWTREDPEAEVIFRPFLQRYGR